MEVKECFLIENSCYKTNNKIIGKPKGIVVHSTGANNTQLRRYVQPLPSQEFYRDIIQDIGTNLFNNHWNKSVENGGQYACVHAFIGTNLAGDVEIYQTLPYDICCWGCGSGAKGSYNFNPTPYLQFEICEDNLTNRKYFDTVMLTAQKYCAELCVKFDIPIDCVISHKEAHDKGYGSNHGDIDHWLKKFNLTMVWFRGEVQKQIEALKGTTQTPKRTIYRVQVGAYTQKKNAETLKAKLEQDGYSPFIVKVEL